VNNRVTSEEVANQFAKAIQLLLEWYRQERLSPTQARESKAGVADSERPGYQTLPELGKLLKVNEVAEILHVSRSEAYHLIQRSDIPAVRMGKAVRVRREDLEAFIKRSKGVIPGDAQ